MERILAIEDIPDCNKEIAYWVIKTIEDIRFKPEPTPPKEFMEFKRSSFKDQKSLEANGFWQDQLIKQYTDSRDMAKTENKGNIDWLTEVKGWLPKEDEQNIQKIESKIYDLRLGQNK